MKLKKLIFYMIGSTVIFVVSCHTIPEIMKKLNNKIYKNSIKKTDEDDD